MCVHLRFGHMGNAVMLAPVNLPGVLCCMTCAVLDVLCDMSESSVAACCACCAELHQGDARKHGAGVTIFLGNGVGHTG